MKGRVILIDIPKDRASRAALLVDGRLEDLLLDPPQGDSTPAPGEIYWAKVDRLVPKIGGAFVKLTPDQTGFLRGAKGLTDGQDILAQVASYPEPGKAPPVTDRVLLKGQIVILTPGAPGINVSRSIKDPDERERLRAVAETAMNEHRHALGPGEFGLVIRTAAAGAPDDWIMSDVAQVVHSWRGCMERKSRATGPACVGGWRPHVIAYTEWIVPMPDALIYRNDEIVDDFASNEVLSDARILRRIEHFDGPDLFDHYGVWDEIDRLKSPRVDLPSGGWMAIEPTRAMVTVDVNTAGEFGGGAALTVNLEAAKELPRQLRLRGLGGQIAIDFAPLPKKDRRRIEDALKTSFRRDPIETTLAGWTPLGHFELQRKRERRPLSELLV